MAEKKSETDFEKTKQKNKRWQNRQLIFFKRAPAERIKILVTQCFFLNGPFPASFSLFSFFLDSKWQIITLQIFHCGWRDSNYRSLVLQVTAPPTAPQPQPMVSQCFRSRGEVGKDSVAEWSLALLFCRTSSALDSTWRCFREQNNKHPKIEGSTLGLVNLFL